MLGPGSHGPGLPLACLDEAADGEEGEGRGGEGTGHSVFLLLLLSPSRFFLRCLFRNSISHIASYCDR